MIALVLVLPHVLKNCSKLYISEGGLISGGLTSGGLLSGESIFGIPVIAMLANIIITISVQLP